MSGEQRARNKDEKRRPKKTKASEKNNTVSQERYLQNEEDNLEYQRLQLELQREILAQEDAILEEEKRHHAAERRKQIEELEDEREAIKLQLKQQQLEYERTRSRQQDSLDKRLEEEEQARRKTHERNKREEMKDRQQVEDLEEELQALKLRVEHQRLEFEKDMMAMDTDFLRHEMKIKDVSELEDFERDATKSKMHDRKQRLEGKVLELQHVHEQHKARRDGALEENKMRDELRHLDEQEREYEIQELERNLEEERLQHERQQLELMDALDRQETARAFLQSEQESEADKSRLAEKMELQEQLRSRRLEYDEHEKMLKEKLARQKEEQIILEKEEMIRRDIARREEMARFEFESDRDRLKTQQLQWELEQQLKRQREITENLEIDELARTEREKEFERLREELQKQRSEQEQRIEEELRSLERERQEAKRERDERRAALQDQLEKERLEHDRILNEEKMHQERLGQTRKSKKSRKSSSSEAGSALSQATDAPGMYMVESEAIVEKNVERGSSPVAELAPGKVVRVLEIVHTEDHIRAQLEKPAGWISVLDKTDGFRWAAPASDFPGMYTVLNEAIVEKNVDRGSKPVAELAEGKVVRVLQIVHTEDRIRGKVEKPAGWISILDKSDDFRWAVMASDRASTDRSSMRASSAGTDKSSSHSSVSKPSKGSETISGSSRSSRSSSRSGASSQTSSTKSRSSRSSSISAASSQTSSTKSGSSKSRSASNSQTSSPISRSSRSSSASATSSQTDKPKPKSRPLKGRSSSASDISSQTSSPMSTVSRSSRSSSASAADKPKPKSRPPKGRSSSASAISSQTSSPMSTVSRSSRSSSASATSSQTDKPKPKSRPPKGRSSSASAISSQTSSPMSTMSRSSRSSSGSATSSQPDKPKPKSRPPKRRSSSASAISSHTSPPMSRSSQHAEVKSKESKKSATSSNSSSLVWADSDKHRSSSSSSNESGRKKDSKSSSKSLTSPRLSKNTKSSSKSGTSPRSSKASAEGKHAPSQKNSTATSGSTARSGSSSLSKKSKKSLESSRSRHSSKKSSASRSSSSRSRSPASRSRSSSSRSKSPSSRSRSSSSRRRSSSRSRSSSSRSRSPSARSRSSSSRSRSTSSRRTATTSSHLRPSKSQSSSKTSRSKDASQKSSLASSRSSLTPRSGSSIFSTGAARMSMDSSNVPDDVEEKVPDDVEEKVPDDVEDKQSPRSSRASKSSRSARHSHVRSSSQEQSAHVVTQDEAVAYWNERQRMFDLKREQSLKDTQIETIYEEEEEVSRPAPITAIIECYHEKRPEVRISKLKKSDGQKALDAQIAWNLRQKKEMKMRASDFAKQDMEKKETNQGSEQQFENHRPDHIASSQGPLEKAQEAKDSWNRQQRRALMTKEELRLEDKKLMKAMEVKKVRGMLRARGHLDDSQRAALKIQIVWLAKRYRKHFLARRRRVILIQDWWRRRRRARGRPVDILLQSFAERQRNVFFATKLQAAYRGFKGRRRVSNMKYFANLEHETVRAKERLRMQREKAALKERLRALGMVHEEHQKKHNPKDPLDLELEMKINEKIHDLQKGLVANEANLKSLDVKHREGEVRGELKRELDETLAALMIQRKFRGMLGRRKVQKMRNAKHTEGLRVEMAKRAALDRKKQSQKRKQEVGAAKKIQALFRGMRARKLVQAIKSDIVSREIGEAREVANKAKRKSPHDSGKHAVVAEHALDTYAVVDHPVARKRSESVKQIPKRGAVHAVQPPPDGTSNNHLIAQKPRAPTHFPLADEQPSVDRRTMFDEGRMPLEEKSTRQIMEEMKQKRSQTKMQAVNEIREQLAEREGVITAQKRRDIRRRHLAATRIQREWRSTLVRRRLEKTIAKKREKDLIGRKLHSLEDRMSDKKAKAAMTIQRIFRGRLGRLEAQSKRSVTKPSRSQILKTKSTAFAREQAAIKIQKVFRGKLGRDRHHELESRKFYTKVNALNSDLATLQTRLRFMDRKSKAVEKAAMDPNVKLQAVDRSLPRKLLHQKDVKDAMSTLKSAMKDGPFASTSKAKDRTGLSTSASKSKVRFSGYPNQSPAKAPGSIDAVTVGQMRTWSADTVMVALQTPSKRTYHSEDARGVPPPKVSQVSRTAEFAGATAFAPRKVSFQNLPEPLERF